MGAGQSVFEGTIPDLITKTKAKELLRDRFDEVKFDAESVFDEELAEEVVSKARFWTIVSELEDATERPASIEVGDQSQAGKLAQKANLVAKAERRRTTMATGRRTRKRIRRTQERFKANCKTTSCPLPARRAETGLHIKP